MKTKRVLILTRAFPRVRQRQPQWEHDGQQHEVGHGLRAGVQGDGEVQGLRLHLLQVGVACPALNLPRLLKQAVCVCDGCRCAIFYRLSYKTDISTKI